MDNVIPPTKFTKTNINGNIMSKLKRITAIALMFVLLLPLVSCSSDGGEYAEYYYFIMDTYVTLKLAREKSGGGQLSSDYLDSTAEKCSEILTSIDATISSHNPSSDVYSLNSEYDVILSADEMMLSMLDTAETVAELTGGAYDYTLGCLTELWNITGGGPNGDNTPPSQVKIDEAMSHCGRDKIKITGERISKLDINVKIDFGGIGKGMAAQQLLEYLDTTDVEYGLVSVGGNVGVFGKKPEYSDYKIGIKDPLDTSGVIGYYYLSSGFVSVSGDYERYFEHDGVRYHHILDPETGYPAESGLHSVAVVASNGAAADALSTALFVMGAERALEFYNEGKLTFEAVFVTDSGEIITTPGVGEKFEAAK